MEKKRIIHPGEVRSGGELHDSCCNGDSDIDGDSDGDNDDKLDGWLQAYSYKLSANREFAARSWRLYVRWVVRFLMLPAVVSHSRHLCGE